MKLPKMQNSMIKIGATNLLNKYYVDAIGNAQIGGLYYVSLGYNIYYMEVTTDLPCFPYTLKRKCMTSPSFTI